MFITSWIKRGRGCPPAAEDNALGILEDVFSDEISVNNTYPLFKGQGSRHQKVFFNNVKLSAFSNNAARTSGRDFDLAWIDEAHEVVTEHKEVFDMIIMTMRAKPTIKLLITMNKGTGTYHHFEKVLKSEFGKEVVFFTIEDHDISHITQKADKKVRTLVKAVGGQDEVARWLDNKRVVAGTPFNPIAIENSYNTYDAYMNMNNPRAAYKVMFVDPSGTKHAAGHCAMACNYNGTEFWELDSGDTRLGETLRDIEDGIGLTDAQQKQIYHDILVEHNIDVFGSESNMNGKQLKQYFLMLGYEAYNLNFGDEKNKNSPSHNAIISMVRKPMDENRIHLKGEKLYPELIHYDPERESDEKRKGNVADAFCMAMFKLMLLSSSKYLDPMYVAEDITDIFVD